MKVVLYLVLIIMGYSCQYNSKSYYEIINGDSFLISKDESKSITTLSQVKSGNLSGRCELQKDGKLYASGLIDMGKRTGTWKFYAENNKINSVIQYYNDSIVTTLDVKDFNFETVALDNIEFVVPINWKINKSKTEHIFFSAMKSDSNGGFNSNFTIIRDSIPSTSTFENYTNIAMNELVRSNPSIELVYQEYTNFNNLRGKRICFKLTVEGNSIGVITYIFNLDHTNLYIVNCTASNSNGNFLKYKGLYEEITSSFKKGNR